MQFFFRELNTSLPMLACLRQLSKTKLNRVCRMREPVRGRTILAQATKEERPDIVDFLINSEACDLDAVDHHGKTALHAACFHNGREIALALLEAGAKPFVRSKRGHLPNYERVGIDPKNPTKGATITKTIPQKPAPCGTHTFERGDFGKILAIADAGTEEARNRSFMEYLTWRQKYFPEVPITEPLDHAAVYAQ